MFSSHLLILIPLGFPQFMHLHLNPHVCATRQQGHLDFRIPSLHATNSANSFDLFWPHLQDTFETCSGILVTETVEMSSSAEQFLHPLHLQSLVHESPATTHGQRVCPLLSLTHDVFSPRAMFFPQEHDLQFDFGFKPLTRRNI